ncbi:MAG: transcription antitermination factor NusB [Lachnospiraceae bacterium]|nr:transcription antitermination factor NusB [Lachnospiraceae bacterium]
MSKREQREQLFKLLFRVEFNERDEMPEQIRLFTESGLLIDEKDVPLAEEEAALISAKYDKIMARIDRIDTLLSDKAEKWSIDRMGKVELAILRLAVYEICFDPLIPTGVAINEAVELAKKYGQDNAGSFVNGILAKFGDQEKIKEDE